MSRVLQPRKSPRTKPPLVVFAPFPPARNGIADYVAELMPWHQSEFDVTLVIADEAPIPREPAPRTLLASEFRRHRSFFSHAPKLYHFGNNPQHCYMLDFIAADPGIVVMHDFNLGYLHEMATLKWGGRDRFIRTVEQEYGALGGAIVRRQFELGFRELFAAYELPLNGSVLEHATAVIAHSRQVQYRVAARVPRTPVWCVPHHLSPIVASYNKLTKAAARRLVCLPADRLVVTAFGFITKAKQIPLTLRALADLRGKVPPFRFLLAGERRPDEYDVNADIAQSGLKDLVTCTDYLDERRFFELLAATDVVVNLRYPSGGETSGTLVRALGMGIPTIVLDSGPIGELPDRAVKKIAWDINVQSSLTDALRELLTNPAARESLAMGAASYAQSVHDIGSIAEKYHQIVKRADCEKSLSRPPLARQYEGNAKFVAQRLRELGERAATVARDADGCWWWRSAPIPVGLSGQRALVVSLHPNETATLLSQFFEWESDAIISFAPAEFLSPTVRDTADRPLACGMFALAVVILPSSQLTESEAALLCRRLNSALCGGGKLVFEVWASVDEKPLANSPLAPADIVQRLMDAGFGEIQTAAPQDGVMAELISPAFREEPRRHSRCVVARRTSDFVVWRYVNQYEGLPAYWGGRIGVPGQSKIAAGRKEPQSAGPDFQAD